MFIACPHCRKTTDCKLEKKTCVVFCIECEQSIDANQFIIQALKGSKEYYTHPEDKGFAFLCKNCKVRRGALLSTPSTAICRHCAEPMDIPFPMINALYENQKFHPSFVGAKKRNHWMEAAKKIDSSIQDMKEVESKAKKNVIKRVPPKPKATTTAVQQLPPKPKSEGNIIKLKRKTKLL